MSKISKQLIAGALSVASATAPLAVTTMNATSTLAASKKKAQSKSSKKSSSKKAKSKSKSKGKTKSLSKKSSKKKTGKKSGKKKSRKKSSKKSTLSSKPSYSIGKPVNSKKDYDFNLPKDEKFTGTDKAVFDVKLKTSEIHYTLEKGKHGQGADFSPTLSKHQYNQATKYVNRWYNEAQKAAKKPELTSDALAQARKHNGYLTVQKNARGYHIYISWVTAENPQGYNYELTESGNSYLNA